MKLFHGHIGHAGERLPHRGPEHVRASSRDASPRRLAPVTQRALETVPATTGSNSSTVPLTDRLSDASRTSSSSSRSNSYPSRWALHLENEN